MAPVGFPFELARHFTPHLALAGLVLAGLSLLGQARVLAGAVAMAALLFCYSWLSTPFAPVTEDAGPVHITVAVFNARYSKDALMDAAQWAADEDVDVIVLAEAHGLEITELEQIFEAWPFSLISDGDMSVFQFRWHVRSAVFSRYPLSETRFGEVIVGQFSRPVLSVNLEHPEGPVQITGLHPFPPGTPGAVIEQGRMFEAVADQVPSDGRFVVMGDLNTTVWSPNFAMLPGHRAGDPRFATTFPAPMSVGGLAIDHIMVGDGFTVRRSERGPNLGSDHYPIIAELVFTRERDNSEHHPPHAAD